MWRGVLLLLDGVCICGEDLRGEGEGGSCCCGGDGDGDGECTGDECEKC